MISMQEDEVTKADSRDMVLLLLYLYQTLPQLVPKATLEFAGKLGDKQVSIHCLLWHSILFHTVQARPSGPLQAHWNLERKTSLSCLVIMVGASVLINSPSKAH